MIFIDTYFHAIRIAHYLPENCSLFTCVLVGVVGELTAQLLVDCQVKTLLVGCYNWRRTYRGRGADDLDIKYDPRRREFFIFHKNKYLKLKDRNGGNS